MAKHVLLCIADDWSPIAACYGDAQAPTPAIDAFANLATVFDHAYCTTPSCAASRASLLTGLHAHQNGQYGHPHGLHHFQTLGDVDTLPAIARRNGVRCTLIGKHHTAPDSAYPWTRHVSLDREDPSTFYRHTAEAMAGDGPSFTMVAPLYPHRGGPDGWLSNLWEDPDPPAAVDPTSLIVPDFLPDLPQVRRDLAGYYQAIARFDACVGAAFRAVQDTGLAQDTLILLLSDHGMPFVGAKGSCYDAGHRCPLIIHAPGQTQPARSKALVSWLDVLPTVQQWLGLSAADDAHRRTGRDLMPLLRNDPPVDEFGEVYASHCFHELTMYDPYRFVRTPKWKYVQRLAAGLPMPIASDLFDGPHWRGVRESGVSELGKRHLSQYQHRPAVALYDLAADPMETRCVADQHPAVAVDLHGRLMRHRIETSDPWLMLDYQRGDPSASRRSDFARP